MQQITSPEQFNDLSGGCKIEAASNVITFYLSTLANWTSTGTANVNAFTLVFEY